MAKKEEKTFTPLHMQAMSRERMDHRMWELKQDFPSTFIIRHRISGEYKSIEKRVIPNRLGS